MEKDLRAFFAPEETIIENRKNSFFKKYYCYGKLIMVGETDFPASGQYFFLHFSETTVSFYPSSRKAFFNEIFHFGWW